MIKYMKKLTNLNLFTIDDLKVALNTPNVNSGDAEHFVNNVLNLNTMVHDDENEDDKEYLIVDLKIPDDSLKYFVKIKDLLGSQQNADKFLELVYLDDGDQYISADNIISHIEDLIREEENHPVLDSFLVGMRKLVSEKDKEIIIALW